MSTCAHGACSRLTTSRATDRARLFIALCPDADVRAALQTASAQWRWPQGASVVPADRLHLTLHFLGELPSARIPALTRALKLPFARCELTLDRAALWRGGIAVLEPSTVPAPLAELHRALGVTLHDLGIATEVHRWRPHVTLAKRAHGEAPKIAPVLWPLHGHALVESRLHPRLHYEVIASFDGRNAAG